MYLMPFLLYYFRNFEDNQQKMKVKIENPNNSFHPIRHTAGGWTWALEKFKEYAKMKIARNLKLRR